MADKQLGFLAIKDEAKGEVEAVISTYNVEDAHGDVVRPGAFKNGAEVVISAYGHASWNGLLPVGKGAILDDGDKALFKGQFFLETSAGRETFKVVKELKGLQEWSYSLQNVEWESGQLNGRDVRFLTSIEVKEVSPVLSGAGVGTQTISVKEKTADDDTKNSNTGSEKHNKEVAREYARFVRTTMRRN